MRPFLIAGNWKMNCGPSETKTLLSNLVKRLPSIPNGVEALVCPPAISIPTAAKILAEATVNIGAQNVYHQDNGAYTGELSTGMLTDAGCSFVIIGHSERREYFGETDITVHKKTKKALAAGLHPIVCIGESLSQRKKEVHHTVVKKQVQAALSGIDNNDVPKVIFAYEPLWAIGTGETATPDQAQEMHRMIRDEIKKEFDEDAAKAVRILYGGSMKPGNAEELLAQPDVDGGLIGGASLKADSFAEIIEIAGKVSQQLR